MPSRGQPIVWSSKAGVYTWVCVTTCHFLSVCRLSSLLLSKWHCSDHFPMCWSVGWTRHSKHKNRPLTSRECSLYVARVLLCMALTMLKTMRTLATAVVAVTIIGSSSGLQIKFDPDFSPPSASDALTDPQRYRAYNRPVFSHIRRQIKIRIEDDDGRLVTEGPDSSLVINLIAETAFLSSVELADEVATVDAILADKKQMLFMTSGSEHPYDPTDHATIRQDGIEVQADRGIAVFPFFFATTPTVYVTNSTTGHPYTSNTSTLLTGVCCKNVWKASTTDPLKADAVRSNPYHVFHRLEYLDIVPLNGSMPDSLLTHEEYPPFEVRLMTLNYQLRDNVTGNPLPMPLLHGPDTKLDLVLSVSWDNKIYAAQQPTNMSVEGMNSARLLYSRVEMKGAGVVTTYSDDHEMRLPVELLPSGYYGAVFSGIHFDRVVDNIRLNVTATHPGGETIYTDAKSRKIFNPPAFNRAGLGMWQFDPMLNTTLWKARPPENDFELVSDEEFRPIRGLYPSVYEGYEENIVMLSSVDNTSTVTLDCSLVEDEKRHAWCLQAGFTVDPSLSVGKSVVLTPSFNVTGRNATRVQLDWAFDGQPEVANYRLWNDMTLSVYDANEYPVTDGPDGSTQLTVNAFELNSNNVSDVKGAATLCDAATSGKLRLVNGRKVFGHALCGIYDFVTLRFKLTSVSGATHSIYSPVFQVQGDIPYGVMLPVEDTDSPFSLDTRVLKMFIDHPVIGFNAKGPSDRTFGHTPGHNYAPVYIDASGDALTAMRSLDEYRQRYRLRQVLGPYKNENAETIAGYLAHQMDDTCHLSVSANTEELGDVTRFPNIYRMTFTAEMYFKALVQSMRNKQWNFITLIHNRETTTFKDTFYAFLRQAGITIAADIKIPSSIGTASLKPYMDQVRAAGSRIVLTNTRGEFAAHILREAILNAIDAPNGFQWVATETTLETVNFLGIPDAHIHFDGAQFLTPMYGLGRAAQGIQATTFSDFLFYKELGGMDPHWVKDLDFDIRKLNMWTFSKTVLALDALTFHGFATVALIDFGITASVGFCSSLYAWIFNLPLHSGSAMNFNSKLDRIGFTGVWAQLQNTSLSVLKAQQEANGDTFNPWRISTTVDLASEDADVIEVRFIDPRTLAVSDPPSYAPNMTLTSRTYVTRQDVDPDLPLFNVTDMVPVTHVCRGGCGGGLLNVSNAYDYAQGSCIGPDECECILTDDGRRAAFIGETCATPNCESVCKNGNCVYLGGDVSCSCEPGWGGVSCEVALCNTYGCQATQGVCTLPDTCVCEEGFFGKDCSGECGCVNGDCNDGASGTGVCSCDENYYGTLCERPCTCLHGQCNDGVNGDGICTACDGGWMGENCDIQLAAVAVPAAISGLLFVAGIVFAIKWALKLARHRALLANTEWRIDWDDVEMPFADKDGGQRLTSMSAMSLFDSGVEGGWSAKERIGRLNDQLVSIARLNKGTIEITPQIRKEVRDIREIHHPNLLGFIGACVEKPNVAILFEYTQKGSLEDLLSNTDIQLDVTFKYHILKDIATGMKFLHGSVFQSHGRLRTASIFVDNRWTVKIADFGLRTMTSDQDVDEELGVENYGSLRWTAPELLSKNTTNVDHIQLGTQAADVYSFGVIMNEVMTREQPYDDLDLEHKEVIQRLALHKGPVSRTATASTTSPILGTKVAWAVEGATATETTSDSLRPTIAADCDQRLKHLMGVCWQDNPSSRPSFKEILTELNSIHPSKGSMVDNLIKMLEKYSQDLEGLVSERTLELAEEKQKVEDLVCRMLPPKIVQDLKVGKNIKAESFEQVTIFFSDIVGFTRICSQSSPFQVVDMLNDLYTCFDAIVEEHDVYKVETIGDAYMVVSGLPERNGDKHAGEIANMSLDMLSAMIDFQIQHLPNEKMQLRVGMHSGPCVAGVVGTKMPRYCLFGDTVNIASRMESGGFALRAHMSDSTYEILQRLGGYHLECRGVRDVKGKGKMNTYWLNGRDGYTKPLPDTSMRVSASQHEFK
eukprot:m.182392 g.182392  ORF g.182392 m.182392 type:complete len:1996 (-) comp14668_c0_seq4:2510-8497(-)